ncbi:MAG: hypothetical protein GOMPHAMPRED_008344 [Gomphillus americanus]|uniref:Uncharacterized protein n=1 Tax=Gomphillus americanus TaxID=1940652 RepID=A0A8H3F2V0_9LECA|nr:MAG: hypothetical protein GOMPHAMPRED_008344 [Gomphillus americanus]
MSWLRRLSRDHTSKIESDLENPEYIGRSVSDQVNNNTKASGATKDSQFPTTGETMRRSIPSRQYQDQQFSDTPNAAGAFEPIPDPLARAYNEALKPYMERITILQGDLEESNNRINLLKNDLDNANVQVNRLENEKASLHNWIDKRGLRPDLPTDLSQSIAETSPVAASTLATQLDRKMTMINFSLHHLADSLPNPIPASTVTDTLSTLLPKISYLSTLPTGPAFAFESLIKLAGNLNSHNSGEETDRDHNTIAEFYTALDDAMEMVVRKRLAAVAEGDEHWEVAKDVRRLEKTATFLRKEMNVRNYFLRSLDVMRGNDLRGLGGQHLPAGSHGQPYSSDSV